MKKHSLSQDKDSAIVSDNQVTEIPAEKLSDKENLRSEWSQ